MKTLKSREEQTINDLHTNKLQNLLSDVLCMVPTKSMPNCMLNFHYHFIFASFANENVTKEFNLVNLRHWRS